MKVILSAAVLAACLSALPATAQVVRPAENPPAGFTGQQYVDSRGCVFMRAGFTGQVNWVPRIGRDRKQICSEITPSQAAARLDQADTVAPPAKVGAPMATVASAMKAGQQTGVFAPIAVPGLVNNRAVAAQPAPQPIAQPRLLQAAPQPVQAPAPQRVQAQPQRSQSQTTQSTAALGCPASAPVLQTLPLSTGGTVTVCTRGDGSATGWISPTYRNGARPGAALQHGHATADGAGHVTGHVTGQAAGHGDWGTNAPVHSAGTTKIAGANVQAVIAGQPILFPQREATNYKAAWEDDRLNPLRGLGTAQGWADQGQVWTNKVPAQTHTDVADKKARRAAKWGNQNKQVTQSTKSASAQIAPQTPAQGVGQIYVQIGSFGQPANAQSAAGRLAGMGLPVASAKGMQGGKQLVAIMAGPFSNAADANHALKLARSAGFGDAFIR